MLIVNQFPNFLPFSGLSGEDPGVNNWGEGKSKRATEKNFEKISVLLRYKCFTEAAPATPLKAAKKKKKTFMKWNKGQQHN